MLAEKKTLLQQQQDLFVDRLPKRPYAADDLGKGIYPMSKALAVNKRHIQPNPPCLNYWLVFDVDRPDAALRWEDAGLPAPTWIARNPANGHAHLAYGLAVPVIRSDAARIAPLRLAAAIQAAYIDAMGADLGYSGLISKNPLNPSWDVVWHYRSEGDLYSLADLAEYVDLSKFGKQRKPLDVGLGRNCTLFDKVRLWAYRAVRGYWKPDGFADWVTAVTAKAGSCNTFADPLPSNEVRSIAKSIAKWVWQRFTPTEFRATQGRRGRRKGSKVREALLPQAKALRAEGLSQQAIAHRLNVCQKTICNWLRAESEA